MFLDASLGILFGWFIFFLVILGLLIVSGAVFIVGLRLRKKRNDLLPWLPLILAPILIFCILGFVAQFFINNRPHKKVTIDLNISQRMIRKELTSGCARVISDEYCDSTKYKFDVVVLFPDGLQFSVTANDIHWSLSTDNTSDYISITDSRSFSLSSAHSSLMELASIYSQKENAEEKTKLKSVGEWILKCCKNNALYSEVNSVQLRKGFGVEFRKNIDEVSLTYSVKPNL